MATDRFFATLASAFSALCLETGGASTIGHTLDRQESAVAPLNDPAVLDRAAERYINASHSGGGLSLRLFTSGTIIAYPEDGAPVILEEHLLTRKNA